MRVRGADFSSAQDIAAVDRAREQGLDFAFVKLTEGGTYVNPLFAAQRQRLALKVGVIGAYHFLTANLDGAAQWDHFEATLRSLNVAGPIAVDHESEHGVMPPDHVVRAFIARAHQRGFKVGRYASGSVFQRTPSLGEDWRWVAWWGPTPPPFHWDVWQFSNGGGRQDWNLYNGDLSHLSAWAHKYGRYQVPPKPKPPRWWLHDGTLARGPFMLARLGLEVVAYAVKHPRTAQLRLERK